MTTLTTEQAAEYLKIHPVTVIRQAKLGIIPSAKPGKRRVFLEEDLKKYLQSLYTKPPENAPNTETPTCSNYANAAPAETGVTNLRLVDKQYIEALARPTKPAPKKSPPTPTPPLSTPSKPGKSPATFGKKRS